MKYERCINCENHKSHEFGCKLDNSNYGKENVDECFVKSAFHTRMDNAISATEKMIQILDKNEK
jgi:hypothetical protein